MKKKNVMSLCAGVLAVPLSVQAAAVVSKPMVWVFVVIAPIMMMNKPTSLFGLALFCAAIALEALIVSRVALISYRSCLKRMVAAKGVSFVVNALVMLVGFIVAMVSEYDMISMVAQKGAVLSMEQKMELRSKFMWWILVLFVIMYVVKIFIEYIAFRRFGLSVQRKTLIKALLFASGASYSIMMVILLIAEYVKIDISGL